MHTHTVTVTNSLTHIHTHSHSHARTRTHTHTHAHIPSTPPPKNPRINNAGTNAYKYGPLLESDDDDLAAIVGTNVLGTMMACKEVRGGERREGEEGALFPVLGFGFHVVAGGS